MGTYYVRRVSSRVILSVIPVSLPSKVYRISAPDVVMGRSVICTLSGDFLDALAFRALLAQRAVSWGGYGEFLSLFLCRSGHVMSRKKGQPRLQTCKTGVQIGRKSWIPSSTLPSPFLFVTEHLT